jgi:uncharacterized membrane protein
VSPDDAVDFALLVFRHTEGAERAYSRVIEQHAQEPWAREVAFVEHHRHDRIVVRGTFAGHYVDADDEQNFVGRLTVEGALGGAAAGALLGPPGFAAGLVAGGLIGSVGEEHSGPKLRSALFDELRKVVSEDASAVILLAPAEEVDAMNAAFAGHDGRLTRHHLPPEAAEALRAAVADSPAAAPSPSG